MPFGKETVPLCTRTGSRDLAGSQICGARYFGVLAGRPVAHRNGDLSSPRLALMDTRWMGPGPPGVLRLLRIVVTLLSPIGGSDVIMLILMEINGGESDDDLSV